MKHPIMTLCGSTKFKEEFQLAEREASKIGYVVLSVCQFSHADKLSVTQETKQLFDDLHKQKIRMSDIVLVVNKGGYIDESTAEEIKYAKAVGIPVEYMFEDNLSTIQTTAQTITICADIRFKDEIVEKARTLKEEGHEVLLACNFVSDWPKEWEQTATGIDGDKQKIRMSDRVIFFDDGREDSSATREKIKYAISIGVHVEQVNVIRR